MRPLIVDSFAGGGGASTGIEIALGRSPDVAINHCSSALALHAANHPETWHLDSNIWDVDPQSITQGRHLGLLWASPDCKHFSKAKGSAPRDRNTRDLAWVVVKWGEEAPPDVICMENVEEFVTWGPLDTEGQPIKELAGVTFDLWVRRLRKAGYKIQWRELRACDYGAPTLRKRWFLIARRDGRPIAWPKPTHGAPTDPAVKAGKLLPWRTAAECIDWSLPCPSIFASSPEIMAEHGLRAMRPLAPATLARIAHGLQRFVLDAAEPFIVTAGAVPQSGPAAVFLAQHHTGVIGHDARNPLSTIAATGSHQMPVAAWLTKYYGTACGVPLDQPCHTITVKDRMAHMNAGLTAHPCSHQHRHRASQVAGLLRTYGTWEGSDDMVTLVLRGETFVITDVGMRMLTPRELYRAQGFPENYIIDTAPDGAGGQRPLPKSVQLSCVGNSVCPPIAAAIVGANCQHLAEPELEEPRRSRSVIRLGR